jgi:hypothetical protein
VRTSSGIRWYIGVLDGQDITPDSAGNTFDHSVRVRRGHHARRWIVGETASLPTRIPLAGLNVQQSFRNER